MKGREESSECVGCGREDIFVLHKIKHKPNFHTLCTNCLLTHHLGLFCPFCFQLYQHHEEEEEEEDKVMCLKCPSLSHLSCIPNSYSHSPPSFLCPSCSTPHFLFFNSPRIDPLSARALVAAAQISAISMTQAAHLARLEADKRVKEAAFAKKRATEALDTLASFAPIHSNTFHSTPTK